jgi:hypothetical protein
VIKTVRFCLIFNFISEVPEDEDWAVFGGDDQEVVYTDFDEVCARIQEITDEKAGTNKVNKI